MGNQKDISLLQLSTAHRSRGHKFFELSNHLGNVLAVISDRRLGPDPNADGLADHYRAQVTSARDYWAFGLELYGRTWAAGAHRFGFNGKENDRSGEWGTGLVQDYGFRLYAPAIGKFLSVDPHHSNSSALSPYSSFANSPVCVVDPDGRDNVLYIVVQKGSMTETELKNYIETTNKFLESMGLNTTAIVAPEGFKKVHTDWNDMVIFIGDSPRSVGNMAEKAFEGTYPRQPEYPDLQYPTEHGIEIDFWAHNIQLGLVHPEQAAKGSGDREKAQARAVGISMPETRKFAKGHKQSLAESLAYFTLHGMGHCLGFQGFENETHPANGGIMMDGGRVSVLLKANNGIVPNDVVFPEIKSVAQLCQRDFVPKSILGDENSTPVQRFVENQKRWHDRAKAILQYGQSVRAPSDNYDKYKKKADQRN